RRIPRAERGPAKFDRCAPPRRPAAGGDFHGPAWPRHPLPAPAGGPGARNGPLAWDHHCSDRKWRAAAAASGYNEPGREPTQGDGPWLPRQPPNVGSNQKVTNRQWDAETYPYDDHL